MWLLNRLAPDHKSIAEFRRMHSEAVTQVGAELIRFARSVGARRVGGCGWIEVSVSSVGSIREREAVKRYLETLESADQEEELVIEPSRVAEALDKLREHREPEAHFMRTTSGAKLPAYNVQAAVDSEHALIAAQQVTTKATDHRSLLPMAEAAQAAVSGPGQVLHVVADAGYSNGEQAEACEAKGILPHVPANRGVNNQGAGKRFDRSAFVYQPEQDRFLCPAGTNAKTPADIAERPFRVLRRSTRGLRSLSY
jgi:transposase